MCVIRLERLHNVLSVRKQYRNAYITKGHDKIIESQAAMRNAGPEPQTNEYGGDGEESPPYSFQSNPVVLLGWELQRQLASSERHWYDV